jgi:hypothetical protein
LGGHEKMLAHHRGLAIAPEERHRFVSRCSASRPTTPAFRTIPSSGWRQRSHTAHFAVTVAQAGILWL